MTTYKLTYFPVKALGEPIRMLLSYAGIDFEDDRFDREHWPNLKSAMPFGQVPVLEVNGKKAHQSMAICRYLARQNGLAGSSDWEALEIDSIADTINDFRQKIGAYHYESDEKIKETKYAQITKEVLPFYLAKFDAIAKENGGHFALGKLTWADIYFVGLLDYMSAMAKVDIVEKYPNLQKVRDNVVAIPAIAKWIAKRPVTEF